MSNWIKKGLIFCPDGNDTQMYSHAAIPFGLPMDDKLRVFYSSRDKNGRSHPFFLDTTIANPSRINRLEAKPLLELGARGTFDDSGIMPSCVVNNEGVLYLYYIGWNPQVTVSYRLSIGLAISTDYGETFKRYSIAPICDRSLEEPYFNTAPFVIKEKELWKMWYISTTGWELIDDYPEPRYHVKYAESGDGIHWKKTGIVCIDYRSDAEAIGRPSVFKEHGMYKMYYSYRLISGYRTNRVAAYRIGYAESRDGITWVIKDNEAGITASGDPLAWDHEMIEYCHVLNKGGEKLMLYNGNGFGKTGFGYATAE